MPLDLVFIPAKGTSSRLPGKNTALIDGKPSLQIVIETLQAAGEKKIMVSSESMKVRDVVMGIPDIAFHLRTGQQANSDATIMDVVCSFLSSIDKSYSWWIGVVLPTATMMNSEDVREAVKVASQFSKPVAMVTEYGWDVREILTLTVEGYLLKDNVAKEELRWNPLVPRFIDCGFMYIFPPGVLQAHKSFYPPGLVGFKIPRWRAIDVNTQEDLDAVRRLFPLRDRQP